MKHQNIYKSRVLASRKIRKDIIWKKKYIDININLEDIGLLIRLLEFAEFEISRNFKRLSKDDIGLKQVYYYYRYGCRRLRKLLQERRGY